MGRTGPPEMIFRVRFKDHASSNVCRLVGRRKEAARRQAGENEERLKEKTTKETESKTRRGATP